MAASDLHRKINERGEKQRPVTFQVHRQITHKYNADYAHLDESEFVCDVTRISARELAVDHYEDGGYAEQHSIVFPPDTNQTALSEGLRDTYRRGCSCEHDCCGHYFGGVNSILFPRRGHAIVTVGYSRNY